MGCEGPLHQSHTQHCKRRPDKFMTSITFLYVEPVKSFKTLAHEKVFLQFPEQRVLHTEHTLFVWFPQMSMDHFWVVKMQHNFFFTSCLIYVHFFYRQHEFTWPITFLSSSGMHLKKQLKLGYIQEHVLSVCEKSSLESFSSKINGVKFVVLLSIVQSRI